MVNMAMQAVTKDTLAAVDGSPQSMLAVVGETHVAGLAEVNQSRRCIGATALHLLAAGVL